MRRAQSVTELIRCYATAPEDYSGRLVSRLIRPRVGPGSSEGGWGRKTDPYRTGIPLNGGIAVRAKLLVFPQRGTAAPRRPRAAAAALRSPAGE